MLQRLTAAIFVLLLSSPAVLAATPHAALDGAHLAWPWALPFVGILLTIATGPLLFKQVWHHHYGKLALAWGVATLLPIVVLHGLPAAIAAFVHAALGEYLSFIVLLFALYVVAGGILVTGNLRGTPLVNTILLAFGTLIASIVGTTGAAMILIRPLLRANEHRRSNAHVVVFFIFLVCNIGGALSPLGDPPLFIGFLRGVSFFWTTQHLWSQTLVVAALVLAVFIVLDVTLARRETTGDPGNGGALALQVHGLVNLALIALIIAAILGSAVWRPGITFDVYGTPVELQNLVRRLCGAAYLLWLAWQALKPNGRSPLQVKTLSIDSPRKLFAMGFVTSLLNPKIAMLYVALLPQFVDPAHGSVLTQSIAFGLIQITVSVSVNALISLSAGSIALFFGTRPTWLKMQRWLMGTVLAGLAVRMAFEARRT